MCLRRPDAGDRGNLSRSAARDARVAAKETPMGRSFFDTRSYNDLRNGSQVFSDLISGSPITYGLTAPLALEYKTLNDDYDAKFLIAEATETRSKVSITNRNDAAVLLKAKAKLLANLIDGTATVTDGQRQALGLSVRATPTPRPAPGKAYEFNATLMGDGSLDSKWKCNNPPGAAGTIYQIFRRTGAAGEFEYLGGVGERKFHDTTIPAGTATVTYKIQAVRSTAVGDWAEFNVNFGMSAGGGMTASVEPAPKLAA
jgi:hypothetical protein